MKDWLTLSRGEGAWKALGAMVDGVPASHRAATATLDVYSHVITEGGPNSLRLKRRFLSVA